MSVRHLTSALAMWLLLASCGQQTSSSSDQATTDSLLTPDSEVFGADISLYDEGTRTAMIEADRIKRFEALDSTMAYTVRIDFLDSLGQVSSNLVGDSGIIRENTQWMTVWGDVVFTASDGARLETDSLVWNPDIQKIRTDAYVELTRNLWLSPLLYGTGMLGLHCRAATKLRPDLFRTKGVGLSEGSVGCFHRDAHTGASLRK